MVTHFSREGQHLMPFSPSLQDSSIHAAETGGQRYHHDCTVEKQHGDYDHKPTYQNTEETNYPQRQGIYYDNDYQNDNHDHQNEYLEEGPASPTNSAPLMKKKRFVSISTNEISSKKVWKENSAVFIMKHYNIQFSEHTLVW